jgi:hydrogenase maturation protease
MATRSASSARPAEAAAAAVRAAVATLVVGLGNPLRGDDGVGWRVVDALRDELGAVDDREGGIDRVELEQLAVGGLTLMEHLVGRQRAILVDAVSTGEAVPGTVTCLPLAELETRAMAHLDSAHDATLPAALEAGRALGAELPAAITVVAIEAVIRDEFDEALTPAVAAAVPRATAAVVAVLCGEMG